MWKTLIRNSASCHDTRDTGVPSELTLRQPAADLKNPDISKTFTSATANTASDSDLRWESRTPLHGWGWLRVARLRLVGHLKDKDENEALHERKNSTNVRVLYHIQHMEKTQTATSCFSVTNSGISSHINKNRWTKFSILWHWQKFTGPGYELN